MTQGNRDTAFWAASAYQGIESLPASHVCGAAKAGLKNFLNSLHARLNDLEEFKRKANARIWVLENEVSRLNRQCSDVVPEGYPRSFLGENI